MRTGASFGNGRAVIRGGRVVDPASGVDGAMDIVVEDGRIGAVGKDAVLRRGDEIIDATGLIVSPGLIDLHAHTFDGASVYAVDPDRAGVQGGVTHVNDMGSSGWITFCALRRVADRSSTHVTCFLNVMAVGIPENWCLSTPELSAVGVRSDAMIALAERNLDVIRGVKVHIERGLMSHAADPWHGFQVAQTVARELDINAYVHLGDLLPIDEKSPPQDPGTLAMQAVERMLPRQVLGHCFSPFPGGLFLEDGRVAPAAAEATRKGILHEIGHGLNLSFSHARRFLDAGLSPDIISSDIHTRAHGGLIEADSGLEPDSGARLRWSMLGTMSKCLALGMSLADVIRASSHTPAVALGLDHCKGSLSVGRPAEISLLRPLEGDFRLTDSLGVELRTGMLLLPAMTIIGSRAWRCEPTALPEFVNDLIAPNPQVLRELVVAAPAPASAT